MNKQGGGEKQAEEKTMARAEVEDWLALGQRLSN